MSVCLNFEIFAFLLLAYCRVYDSVPACFFCTVVRGEKARKEYAILLQKHKAAVCIQKQIRGRTKRKTYENVHDASIVIQSGNC